MDAKLKTAILEAGEETLKVLLSQGVKVAEAYAVAKPSALSAGVAQGLKLANEGLLQDLADKINPAD